MRWFVSDQGNVQGPMDSIDVRMGIDSGRFTRGMHIRDEGGNWMPIEESPFGDVFVGGRKPRPGERKWSPGIAAVLSFFIPGLGQIYKAQVIRGLIWMGVTAIGYWMLIVPGLILHLCCIIGATRGDPTK